MRSRLTIHLVASWTLAGALAAIGLAAAPLERAAYRSDAGSRRKLAAYAVTMAAMWILAVAALWICSGSVLIASPAGTTASCLPIAWVAGPVLATLTAIYLVIALLQLLQSLRGPRWRTAYAAAMRRGFSALPGLLPNTAAERAAFALLSLSAGICEELLFRGFLIRLLHEGALALPVAGALGISSVVFGLGHAYQGWKGVCSTAIGGLALGLVFLLTGSLIPAIVLHALLDLQIPHVLRPASAPTTREVPASA